VQWQIDQRYVSLPCGHRRPHVQFCPLVERRVFDDCFRRDRENVILSRRTGSRRLRFARAPNTEIASWIRRNAILAFSGILASSALSTMPRRAESGQATRITPLQYKTQTLQVGTFSKETSQLAVAQAIHPRVKQFAQFEVNEQTAMAQVLTDLNNPPPVPLDAQHAALLQQLQSQSGKGFDIAYI
jgi:hypothetical protein